MEKPVKIRYLLFSLSCREPYFTLSCIIRKLWVFCTPNTTVFRYRKKWKEVFILPTLETNYRNRYCILLISTEFLPVLRNIISESAAICQIIYIDNMNDD